MQVYFKMDEDTPENLREEHVFMAIYTNKNYIGLAYYQFQESVLYIIDDFHKVGDKFDEIQSIFENVKPSKLITLSNQSRNIFDPNVLLKSEIKRSENGNIMPCKIVTLVAGNYSYYTCLNKVRNLKVLDTPNKHFEKCIILQSFINPSSYCSIYALGILLLYIDQYYFSMYSLESKQFYIKDIQYITLKDYLFLDKDSFSFLNILPLKVISHMKQEWHSVNFQNDRSNHSDAEYLFSYMNPEPRIGTIALRKMFLHPTTDTDVLENRFDFITFCMEPSNQIFIEKLKNSLAGIVDSAVIANNNHSLGKRMKTYRNLHKILQNIANIKIVLEAQTNRPDLLTRFMNNISSEIQFLLYFLENIFDLQSPSSSDIISVKHGVDPTLDKLRTICYNLPQTLSTISLHYLLTLPKEIENCHVVYIPEMGFLIAVLNAHQLSENSKELPKMTYHFSLNGISYYKNLLTEELNRSIGDIGKKIRERSFHIFTKITNYLNQYADIIQKAISACSSIDALIILYEVALKFNYVRPILEKGKKKISIVSGRHPLQERTTKFVPTDIFLDEKNSFINIIQGSNGSGKTTFIKQLALIIFLAHIGSFVPADSAILGTISHLFIKAYNLNGSERINFFLQDIRQIFRIFHSTDTALILIDDFGDSITEYEKIALISNTVKEMTSTVEPYPYTCIVVNFDVTKIKLSNEMNYFTVLNFRTKNTQPNYLKLRRGNCRSHLELSDTLCLKTSTIFVHISNRIKNHLKYCRNDLQKVNDRRSSLLLNIIQDLFFEETILHASHIQKILEVVMDNRNILS
ncbi:DNA mismatch repair protein MSH5-like isoform X1 [Trichogramma pretiosum]|uniref:DNA mismatch repair protein MSH5-like isoform X1 n=3 Tax=Trichogramma pretiosum TaxID=7493 RepID=UPI0006C9C39C|nr:DNA mismatch repair protein MSH5-like isoform X1 [Trichogramma pretiosum]